MSRKSIFLILWVLFFSAGTVVADDQIEKNLGIGRESNIIIVPEATTAIPVNTKVSATVDHPSGSTCILKGYTGTVYCYDAGDPSLPYLVNWDQNCGFEQCQVCGRCAPHGWWVGASDITPAMKVQFKERGTYYGWDNHTSSVTPAKSVRAGYTDTVLAAISPADSYSSCAFKSMSTAYATVSPAKAASASQTVTIKGIAKGSSQIQARNGTTVLRKMNAYTYNKMTKSVAVTLVHKKGTGAGDPGYVSTNIPTADITAMLQKVYKQAVRGWTVVRLPSKSVAFDLNKDGKIDVESWMSAEMRVIRDACKSSHAYNIFIVSHPTDGSTGFMSFNQKYGFIHADTGGNSRTVAHELGHGLGLVHTPADAINIMYNYTSTTKWRLRKGQWDTVNP